MTTITECIVRDIRIPFNTGFTHALATRRQTRAAVFEIVTDDGIRGFGEATPRDYVTGESMATTIAALNGAAAALIGVEIPPADGAVTALSEWLSDPRMNLAGAPSARCALELALLDACGNAADTPVADLLGRRQTESVAYSGVISDESIDRTLEIVEAINAFGLRQVKIKAGRDCAADTEKLTVMRKHLDAGVELRVDANGAWSYEEALKRIDAYHQAGIAIVEQPLPAQAREHYPRLCTAVGDGVVILLDESLCSVDDARWFVENRGAGGFSLKISKHGGIVDTLAIHRLGRSNGMRVQLGCHVGETSLLTAAGMTVAALTADLIACEGAFGTLLLSHDITTRPLQFGRHGRVDLAAATARPGLGVDVDADLLASATAHRYRHVR